MLRTAKVSSGAGRASPRRPGLRHATPPDARACPHQAPGTLPRGDAGHTTRQPMPQTTPRQEPWGGVGHHGLGAHHQGCAWGAGGLPSRMVDELCQRWKTNAEARGIAVADMGLCAACQQAAVAALPVRTAAGQHTLWQSMRDTDRLAASWATARLLPAWWDRCVVPAPARVCPCGRYQVRWDVDEATERLRLSGLRCGSSVRCGG
jgi:hypothetical protein